MKYNYGNLSDIEFEELCRDILSVKKGIFFESFKKGKDGGIDLRYAIPAVKGGEDIIVQCKHYFKTPFAGLKSDLLKDKVSRKSELSKIKILNKERKIQRYILMCSTPLNPGEKREIMNGFEGFIQDTGDIMSLSDIEGLISKEIEKKHFKLWLNSYTVVETLFDKGWNNILNCINKGIINRSNFSREDILSRLEKFVAIPKIGEAMESLNKNNIVILSGEAGIGKTTLAEVLLLPYFKTKKQFEFIEISEDISEGIQLFDKDKKQIFYYDDFLGRRAYQGENKNEAKRINKFIEQIIKSDNKKLIFTTREYVLKDAEEKEDEFNLKGIVESNKIIVNIDDYGLIIKGKILYNHLYFSDLSDEYKDKIFENKNYLKIIQHKNYSPRLIEQFTKKDIINNDAISPSEYSDFIFASLENPSKIWKSGYLNLSSYSQNILIILGLYEFGIYEDELHDDLNMFIGDNLEYLKFKSSLKLIEGSFISIDKRENYNRKTRVVSTDREYKIYCKNPSVGDFIINEVIKQDSHLIDKLINVYVGKDELFDFMVRYFHGNEAVKVKFVTAIFNSIDREKNIESKFILYIKLLVENKNLVHNYDGFKEKFKLFLDNDIFPNYTTIEDKSLFVKIFNVFYFASDFKYFNSEDEGGEYFDDTKLEDFQNDVEQYLYDYDLYTNVETLESFCFFVSEHKLKPLYGKQMIEGYIDYHGLGYNSYDRDVEEIESKINDLESLKGDYIGEIFDGEIYDTLVVLESEKEKLEEYDRQQEPEDYDSDFEFSNQNITKGDKEINEIINLFER